MNSFTGSRPLVRQSVRTASPYVPDWAGLNRADYIRLDRNEATRPLSEHVAAAITRYVNDRGVHSYPDYGDLTADIAAYCGSSERSVLPTNGSDQGIELCLRAFLSAGQTMLVARPEFSIFGHIADLLQVVVQGVPFGPDLEFPYDEFREELRERPDLIVLINPNNPTGTPIDLDFIEEVARAWPDVPVVVDEAYFEFTGKTVVPLLETYRNLIVIRTFSKAFAMAGLRLGYLVADQGIIDELTKIRNPFDVNILAAIAVRAQLTHPDEVHRFATELMTVVKPATVAFFERHGNAVWPGAANFVLVRPDDCEAVIAALGAERILVRRMGAAALAGTFRMSIGTEAEMARVHEVYAGILSAREATGSDT